MATRRRMLATLGAAVFASGTASAGHDRDDSYGNAQPAHVTITEDIDELESYRPALDLSATDRSRFQALRGWKATSPEYDLDWYVYFAEWTHQSGVSDWDSHLGDREPFYVGIDESGAVARVDYSVYHWLHGQAAGSAVPLDDAGHPLARVNAPYHHYELGATTSDRSILPDVTALSERLGPWLDNGIDEDLRVGAVHDPASMQFASSWWQDDLDGQLTELSIEIARFLGQRGAQEGLFA